MVHLRNEELSLADEIRQTEEQPHVYEALAALSKDAHAMLDVILEAEDSDQAVIPLQEQFALSRVQAAAVMKVQYRRANRAERTRIEARHQELVEHLAFLRDLSA